MHSNAIIQGILNRSRSVARMTGAIVTVLRNSEFDLPINKIQAGEKDECIVLGNGPSLEETLTRSFHFFDGKIKICVNQFALSEYFEKLKPDYYVFLDPTYWAKTVSHNLREEFCKLSDQLKKVTWPMKILIPTLAREWNIFLDLSRANKNIEIVYFNRTMIAPTIPYIYILYKNNLAMPQIQNVLVGCIFLALNMRFKKIYLLGADHSWHENIHLDDDNNLYCKEPHFYEKAPAKLIPFYKNAEETARFRMHELLAALSLKFEGYIILEDYAKHLGAKVYNGTPKSYIDAFERYKIATE